MLDSYLRSPYQRFLIDPIVTAVDRTGIPANAVTLLACALGLAVLPLLALGQNLPALLCLLLSGYCDTLDGSLARLRHSANPAGTVLDIVCDRSVEMAVILGLFLVEPSTRGLLCLLMLGSILLCVTSFLVVGIFSENQSEKSFHYSPGLMERTEAFILFGAMMLAPSSFTWLALIFAAAIFLTSAVRVYQFSRQQRQNRSYCALL